MTNCNVKENNVYYEQFYSCDKELMNAVFFLCLNFVTFCGLSCYHITEVINQWEMIGSSNVA